MRLPSDPVSIDLGARLAWCINDARIATRNYHDVVDLVWAHCDNLHVSKLEMTLSTYDTIMVTSPEDIS